MGHFVKAHFVDDGLNVGWIVREESYAPLPVVESGRAGDELTDAAGIGAADAHVAAHELAPLLEIERVPILPRFAPFAHGVEAEIFPGGQHGIEAVVGVMADAFAEGDELRLRFGAAAGEPLIFFEFEGVVLVLLCIFRLFGHGQISELGHEHVGSERRGDFLFQRVEFVEVGRENHETDVGSGEHGERDDLGLRLPPGGGEKGVQPVERDAAFLGVLGAPGREIDAVKKVERAESFLGTKRAGGILRSWCVVGHVAMVEQIGPGETQEFRLLFLEYRHPERAKRSRRIVEVSLVWLLRRRKNDPSKRRLEERLSQVSLVMLFFLSEFFQFSMNRRLPVMLVGGFLGSGKTSFLHHIISEHRGGYLAVLVDNPGALNLDAKALRGLCGAMRRQNDTVREIPSGDEASQVEWIAGCLREFSEAGRLERVLFEVSGTTNPARFARHFGLLPGHPATFSPWAELEQIVCVVDALDFLRASTGTPTEMPLRDFANEQIAGASLVVLNKCDLLEDKELELCRSTLRRRHERARVVETAYGEVPADVWTTRATAEELRPLAEQPSPGKKADAAAADLASALYCVHRPFHPGRFWDWFNGDHAGLLRVKGIVWLATRNLLVGGLSRTRWQNSCGAAGIWWAALPREEWPQEPSALMRMQEVWREPYGDRRQELVLIGGAELLSTVMRRELDACLLTEEEFARPLEEWTAFPDPFPAWDMDGG